MSDARPPERVLDGPPDPSEGRIIDVDLDRTNDLYHEGDEQACQHCGEPVPLSESHVSGWIRRRDVPAGPVHATPVFCDEECWAEWGSPSG